LPNQNASSIPPLKIVDKEYCPSLLELVASPITDGTVVVTTDRVIATTALVTTMVIVVITTMVIMIITTTNQPEIRIYIKSERERIAMADHTISSYN
jgi:hypothetical protein